MLFRLSVLIFCPCLLIPLVRGAGIDFEQHEQLRLEARQMCLKENYSEAEDIFFRILDQEPDSSHKLYCTYALANIYLRTNRASEALPLISEILYADYAERGIARKDRLLTMLMHANVDLKIYKNVFYYQEELKKVNPSKQAIMIGGYNVARALFFSQNLVEAEREFDLAYRRALNLGDSTYAALATSFQIKLAIGKNDIAELFQKVNVSLDLAPGVRSVHHIRLFLRESVEFGREFLIKNENTASKAYESLITLKVIPSSLEEWPQSEQDVRSIKADVFEILASSSVQQASKWQFLILWFVGFIAALMTLLATLFYAKTVTQRRAIKSQERNKINEITRAFFENHELHDINKVNTDLMMNLIEETDLEGKVGSSEIRYMARLVADQNKLIADLNRAANERQ